MKNLLSFTILISLVLSVKSQDFNVNLIPENLAENAYAVIRNENTFVEFLSYGKANFKHDIAVTVLSESGLHFGQIPAYYNNGVKIKNYEAVMYFADGSEMRKLKKRDIKDVSIYDGFSLFRDDRLQYFEIVPISYPFTIQYHLEFELENTLSLPGWNPLSAYDLSVEKSTYTLINQTSVPIRKLEKGFDGWPVQHHSTERKWTYSIENLSALQDEIYSPELSDFTPNVKFAPTEFEWGGIKGRFENWREFGKWYYDNLLYDKRDLSSEEKAYAKELVKNAKDTKEKVRILYQYMQTKTRYINISIGIGGLEPFPASYVSNKSYGDCKALSNYMISLLEAVGIQGFHTVVYGESARKENLTKDFASFQGNHMIVNVPLENDTIWLESTNQQTAFNYLGHFTDGRLALSVTPEGGKIVKTQSYDARDNKEINTGKGILLPNGDLKADFSIRNIGLEYDLVYRVSFENSQNQKIFLNNWLDDLPNLKINQYEFHNDRDNAVFQTDIEVESKQFAKVFGNNMTLNLVPVTRLKSFFKKDDNRKFPFDIRYGYNYQIEFELEIPTGFKMAEIFEPLIFVSEFGNYILTLEESAPGKILIKRSVQVKDGIYPKDKFNDFVDFKRKISSFDNTKILLEKI